MGYVRIERTEVHRAASQSIKSAGLLAPCPPSPVAASHAPTNAGTSGDVRVGVIAVRTASAEASVDHCWRSGSRRGLILALTPHWSFIFMNFPEVSNSEHSVGDRTC
jgi:hypothetical protein